MEWPPKFCESLSRPIDRDWCVDFTSSAFHKRLCIVWHLSQGSRLVTPPEQLGLGTDIVRITPDGVEEERWCALTTRTSNSSTIQYRRAGVRIDNTREG